MATVRNNHDSLGFNEMVDLILAVGLAGNSIHVEGHMGSGKSALHGAVCDHLKDTHVGVSLDATQMVDQGDLVMMKFKTIDGVEVVGPVPQERLGLHFSKPVVLFIDEVTKNRSLIPPLLQVMNEHSLLGIKLPEGSIVMSAGNLGAEGVGDVFPAHACNRVVIAELRNPTAMEWVEQYAVPNGLHSSIMATAIHFPMMFDSFRDVEDPKMNPYIMHPKAKRRSFVTARSMARASSVMYATEKLPSHVRMHALCGTVGEAAAAEIMTIDRLESQIPVWDRIVADPTGAPIPDSAVAQCIVVLRAVKMVTHQTMDAWVVYMMRLGKETQALFARSMLKSSRSAEATVNGAFKEWLAANSYLFGG